MPMMFASQVDQQPNRGRVVFLGGGLATFRMGDWIVGGGTLATFKSIITDVAIVEQGNYQFLHTMGNHIYLYIFGDRIGQLNVSGLSFWSRSMGGACDNNPADLGIVRALKWYRQNRILNRESPIEVNLGSQGFQAYLLGFRCNYANLHQRAFKFTMSLALLPPHQA